MITHEIPNEFYHAEDKILTVAAETKAIWAVELDLLAEFDRVCKRLSLKYTIAYGTLLGAVRHKGFIPWDNDVDVLMLRKDYEILCAHADEFKHPYFLQNEESDPGSGRGHGQLRNSSTTGILKSDMLNGEARYSFNQGIFLDVFILDDIPEDPEECAVFLDTANKLKAQYQTMRRYLQAFYCGFGRRIRLIGWFMWLLQKCFKCDFMCNANERHKAHCTKYTKVGRSRVAPVSYSASFSRKHQYPKSWFEDLIELPFEHLQLSASRYYEDILQIDYGNWRKHVVGGDAHGGVFFDVNHPYTDYLKSKRLNK